MNLKPNWRDIAYMILSGVFLAVLAFAGKMDFLMVFPYLTLLIPYWIGRAVGAKNHSTSTK